MPHGLKTRGSAEDLAKEAEEYKKLRKAGKGGFANQVKNKAKAVSDKMEELDSLKAQLDKKPPHMLLVLYDSNQNPRIPSYT